MKRTALIFAACAAAVVPASLVLANGNSNNSSVSCSEAKIAWTGFNADSTRTRDWRVLVNGSVVKDGKHTFSGPTGMVIVPLDITGGKINLTAEARVGYSGPFTVVATASGLVCNAPTTTGGVPPTAPEPPASTTTTPGTTTAPKPPKPPKQKPVRDCIWLRVHGAGIKTLKARGCYIPPKKCKAGEKRTVYKKGGVIVVTCIKPDNPAVTG